MVIASLPAVVGDGMCICQAPFAYVALGWV